MARRTSPLGMRHQARRSRRFAFGLTVYLVATVVTFAMVYRYTRHIARLYGYDIENVWLQFGLYLLIFVALVEAVEYVAGRVPVAISPENALRLALLAGLTLDAIVALYQSRFGPRTGVDYFLVGGLGVLAASLDLTRRRFGWVEVVSPPEPGIARAVELGHAGVVLANGIWDRAKRVLELGLAVSLSVISLPISIPLALALLIQDPGPLLVAKVAVKRGGRSFRQLKLRTMVKNAEKETGPVPAAPQDLRVTWLGGLLRRTHIDELPQMLNVLRGDMSLVGPRPERTVFVHRHLQRIRDYRLRHAVRPGLAGMAQVYGDYYSTPRQKLRYDLLYIRRRSPGLDLKLFLTAVLMALVGIRPGRRQHQRDRHLGDELGLRWRRAYRALRGEEAPPTLRQPAPGCREPTSTRTDGPERQAESSVPDRPVQPCG